MLASSSMISDTFLALRKFCWFAEKGASETSLSSLMIGECGDQRGRKSSGRLQNSARPDRLAFDSAAD